MVEAFFEFSVSQPGFSLHVVTGGQLPDKGYREVVRRVAGRADVRLSRVVPGLARRLNHYRLVISMGGYNACTELYQASTREHRPPAVRARLRRANGAGSEVPQGRGGRLDHGRRGELAWLLAEVMARALAAPPSPRLPVDVGGADATAKSLASEPARRRPGLLTS